MNNRERILAIAVGGLVVVMTTYWAFGRFKSALDDRRQTLESVQTTRDQMNEQRLGGEYAANTLGEFVARALPGNIEDSSRKYAGWLLELAQKNEFENVIVDPIPSIRRGDLYDQLSFRIAARGDMRQWIEFVHAFYQRDRLHRIRAWSLRQNKQGRLQIEMTVDALAMNRRPNGLEMPTGPSGLLQADLADYRRDILDRNFFESPNQAPRLKGSKELVATTGQKQTVPILFEDPEGHELNYELVDAPENISVSIRSNGALQIEGDQAGTTPITVRVSDDGYPRRSVDQTLLVRINDPPPPPSPKPAPKKFDEAKQTVMVATVQGRPVRSDAGGSDAGGSDAGDNGGAVWEVWLRIRTRDETLKLKINDPFEIGSVKGSIAEVGPSSAMIRVGQQRFEIVPNQTLVDAIGGDAIDDGTVVDDVAAEKDSASISATSFPTPA